MLNLDRTIAVGVHIECGGLIFPHCTEHYRYCAEHAGECSATCPGNSNYPAIYCDTCQQEIGGDAEIDKVSPNAY